MLGLKQSCIARCTSVIRQTQWSSSSQAKCNKLRKLGVNINHAVQFAPIPYHTKHHGRKGRKKLGGRKEICPTFSDCARVVKKNFPAKLSKIVVDGGGGRSDYEKFLLDSIFPTKLTEFHTKLTEFVPFIFIISQYSPRPVQYSPRLVRPCETQYPITILLKAKVNHYSLDIFLFNNSILRNTRPARVEH